MTHAAGWLFRGECGSSRGDIVRWWESRRLLFNVLVGVVGIATSLTLFSVALAGVDFGLHLETGLTVIFVPLVYGFMANLCYTLGWIVDTNAYRGSPRRWLFKAGLIFSMGLTALPGLWAVAAWLMTLYTGKQLD
jgi:hypothetical protein